MYQILSVQNRGDITIYDPMFLDIYPAFGGHLTQELNQSGSLQFTLVHGHPLYDELAPIQDYVKVLDDGEEIFYGRVISISDPTINGQITVQCEGALSFLMDSEVNPSPKNSKGQVQTETLTAEELFTRCIQQHNAFVNDPRKQFTIGLIEHSRKSESDTYQFTNYTQTKQVIESNLLDKYGGWLRIRSDGQGGHLIDWLEDYTTENPQEIVLGENVISQGNQKSGENLYTVIRPLGKDGLELTEKTLNIYPAEDMAKYGRIVKTVQFNSVTTEDALRTKAQEMVSRVAKTLYISSEIKMVDMHYLDGTIPKVRIGDVFTRIHKLEGSRMIAAVVERDFDLPQNDSFRLRNVKELQGGDLNARESSTGGSLSKRTGSAYSAGQTFKYIHEIEDKLTLAAKEIQISADTLVETGRVVETISYAQGVTQDRLTAIEGTGVIQNSEAITNVAGRFTVDENGNVTLLTGTEFKVSKRDGATTTVLDELSQHAASINTQAGKIVELTGSALWTQRNKITGVVGDFRREVDPDTGEARLVIVNGGGLKVERNGVEYGLYDNGNLTGGMIVDKLNDGSTVTKIRGDKLDLSTNDGYSTLVLSHEGLSTTVGEQGGQISTLSNTVDGLSNTVTGVDGRVSTLSNTVDGMESTVGTLNTTVTRHNTKLETIEGSALWNHRDDITGVVGEFQVVTDQATGKKTLKIISGGGMKIVRDGAEYGVYDNGNLTGGVVVNKLNDGSTVTKIRGDKLDLSTNDGYSTLVLSHEGLSTTVGEQGGQISTLSNTVDGLSNTVTGVDGRVSTLSNTVDGLSNTVTGVDGRVSTLSNTVDGLSNTVTGVDGRVSTLSNTVDGLSNTVTGVDGRVSTLSNTVDGLSNTVTGVDGRVSTLSNTVDGMESTVRTLQTTVTGHGTKLETIEGSALWNHRDDITGVVGEFQVVTDQATGKKTLKIISGGGMKIVRDGVEYGLYDDGNLTGGLMVQKINDVGTVTKISGDRVDITASQVRVGSTDTVAAWMETTDQDISDLEGLVADKATIGALNAQKARIDTIVADYITTSNLATKIASANKITTRDLDVSGSLRVVGDSGNSRSVTFGPYVTVSVQSLNTTNSDGATVSMRSGVYDIQLVEGADNTYTLQKKRYQDTGWTDVATFRKAASGKISGSWSGNTYTAVMSSSGVNEVSFAISTVFGSSQTGYYIEALRSESGQTYSVSNSSKVYKLGLTSSTRSGAVEVQNGNGEKYANTPSYALSGYWDTANTDGKNAVNINKGTWSGGIIQFTKSTGAPDTKTIQLVSSNASWDGNTATVQIWDGTAADTSHGTNTGKTVSVNASARYTAGETAGKNAVTITKGSWSGGKITFSKSAGTASDKTVQLVAASASWSGNTASVAIWDGTAADSSHGVNTGYTVSVNAKGRYDAGWGAAKGKVSIPATASTESSITVSYPTATVDADAGTIKYVVTADNNYAYIKVGSTSGVTVARATNGAYANGWGAAVGKNVIPASANTGSDTMTVKHPSSTVGGQTSTNYTVSADGTYAYIKNGSTIVARYTHSQWNEGKKSGWSSAVGQLSVPTAANTGSTFTVKYPSSTVGEQSSNAYSISADGTYAYLKYGSTVVARYTHSQWNEGKKSGWSSAVGQLSVPTAANTGSTFTVKYPSSTVGEQSSNAYSISADGTYAYLKYGSTVVARYTHSQYSSGYNTGYVDGWNAFYGTSWYLPSDNPPSGYSGKNFWTPKKKSSVSDSTTYEVWGRAADAWSSYGTTKYNNGWAAAKAKVSVPATASTAGSITVSYPTSTVGESGSIVYAVDADNIYAYIKIGNASGPVVARMQHNAYSRGYVDGWNAYYGADWYIPTDSPPSSVGPSGKFYTPASISSPSDTVRHEVWTRATNAWNSHGGSVSISISVNSGDASARTPSAVSGFTSGATQIFSGRTLQMDGSYARYYKFTVSAGGSSKDYYFRVG